MQLSLFGSTYVRLGGDGAAVPLAGEEARFRAAGKGTWVADASGFNVHAGVTVRSGDREGLERLCRYCARPPFSLERLSILAAGRVAYLPRTQPGKSARERDRVLDRDGIACHDAACEQQPNEPLAALKVQLIQPCSECRGKGGEIVSEPVEPSASHLLCLKLLPPCVRGFLLCFQPLAPCMEFFDLDGAGLVRIDESIHLGLELACGLLESDDVACPLRCAVPARSPRLDLLLEHLWTPDPGHDCIPDDPVKLISTDTGRRALSWISLVNYVVVGLAFVEEVLVAAAALMPRCHTAPALAADNQCSEQVLLLHTPP